MRFIVHGVGAIGGAVAAALTLAGEHVVGIARGRQLEALQNDGLLFRTPHRTERVHFECFGHPRDIGFAPGDVIVLTTKSQDTEAALLALREAGVENQPILCAQNGVANERAALRLFPNVYAVTVMMPADYIVPGEVNCFGTPRHGIFEIGRYPSGSDADCEAVCATLERAGLAAFPEPQVMQSKYGKLLLNLRNVIEAAIGKADAGNDLFARALAEAEATYRAAGIVWRDVGTDTPRRKALMQLADIEGITRTGGSSTQSLSRGAGSIETDYLNGEIVLLGRLHGVATPVNAGLCRLARSLVANAAAPGSVNPDDIERLISAA